MAGCVSGRDVERQITAKNVAFALSYLCVCINEYDQNLIHEYVTTGSGHV